MNLLLDSHAIIWWLVDSRRLTRETLAHLSDQKNTIFFSAASIWEIGIKQAKGRLEMPDRYVSVLLNDGFEPLSITPAHALAAAQLPPIHNDPFDRMLIAQAREEGLTLVTHDARLKAYGVGCLVT